MSKTGKILTDNILAGNKKYIYNTKSKRSWMFWAKVDVLKKNQVRWELLCKSFAQQNTHTPPEWQVSAGHGTRATYTYSDAHSEQLSPGPCGTSFSQPIVFLHNLISIFLTLPHLQTEEMPENCVSSFMNGIKSHSLVKSPLTHPYFLLCAISVPHMYSYSCMYYTTLNLLVHISFPY